MKYELIFLIILVSYITFISIFVNDVKLFLTLLLIGFLILYELFRYYFKKRIQDNLDIMVYVGIGIFIIIVFQKILEILNR
jgi:predicted membrane channel-forming protein YqfA (hemolysin III family)